MRRYPQPSVNKSRGHIERNAITEARQALSLSLVDLDYGAFAARQQLDRLGAHEIAVSRRPDVDAR